MAQPILDASTEGRVDADAEPETKVTPLQITINKISPPVIGR